MPIPLDSPSEMVMNLPEVRELLGWEVTDKDEMIPIDPEAIGEAGVMNEDSLLMAAWDRATGLLG